MAHIRQVIKNELTNKWAFIEYSDEHKYYLAIMGGKEFDSEGEAIQYSKGFEPFSYEYQEPKLIRLNRLEKWKEETMEKLKSVEEEIKNLKS